MLGNVGRHVRQQCVGCLASFIAMGGALALITSAPALPAVASTATTASQARVTVRPESRAVRRAARLRLRVAVRDVPSEILVASVLVTLRPVVRGPSLRRVVVFAPDESGSRYVTIGINVPRRAQRGQYRLAARLIDEEQQTVLARFADPVAVGVR